jgi:hypothetical protein
VFLSYVAKVSTQAAAVDLRFCYRYVKPEMLKKHTFLCALLALPLCAFPFGKKDAAPDTVRESPNITEGQVVEVTGLVRLIGNEPFPRLVITGSDGTDWYVSDSDQQAIAACQQQTVTVQGTVRLAEMTLANGVSLGTRRILHGVTVLRRQQ